MSWSEHTRRRARIGTVTFIIGAVAIALVWSLVWTELHAPPTSTNWALFAVIAGLLLICERLPPTWIRSGPIGVVTPMWMFAYALLLLGSPSIAVAIALLGTTTQALVQLEPISSMVLRVSGAAISLTTAALVLTALGVHGSITHFDRVPWNWALAIVLAGIAIVVLNALTSAISGAVRRNASFLMLARRGFATRLTAEGALLSLAPIWIIGIDFSLVLVPLLAITTLLVFRSTRQALERLHDAHHDPLTGLMNRRSFLQHLDDVLAGGRSRATLLIMDLNGFKEVNDRLGHQVGDSLLLAFADRLVGRIPADSSAARLGGDEFAILLGSPTDSRTVDEVVADLHAALTEPLRVDGFPVSMGVSIGVSSAPDDGHTTRDLLRAADVAMYKAKRTGRAIEHYDNCVKGPQRGRVNLLSELGIALQSHQLYIHFQPQLRVADGSVDTVEALIRWQHPEHGAIPPSEFIGLAEQTDLIAPITEMVLRVATAYLLTEEREVKLAVNVSARSLHDPQFATQVFEILADTGFPPDRLELEVTERALVANVERTRFTLERLREAGIRVAIDDFGAGYSSYQTLRALEVDRVKIDRDFVAGLAHHHRDQLIVASLIRLAHDLSLDVVAEGVEDLAVWDAVAALGCDVAQGYGIAVPMDFHDLRVWLSRWNEVLYEQLLRESA